MSLIETPAGPVSVAWDTPSGAVRAVFVLAPGAGGTLNSPGVRDIGEALAMRGIAVQRFNFAYSEDGRKLPDAMPKLLDVWRAVAGAAELEHPGIPLFIGGRSMGGRIASNMAADGFDCAGLIFLAYPLHPPGKPERIRDAHLPEVKAPMLFIQGTSDPFATPSLMDATMARLPAATLIRIEGADHSFKVRGRAAAEVTSELADYIDAFVRRVNGQPGPR